MADEPKEVPEKKGSPIKSLILGAVLLVALVIGSASAAVVVASFALRPANGSSTEAEESASSESADATEGEPAEFAFEEALIVNVRQTQQRRYLSATPVFELANEKVKKTIEDRLVELKHLLITTLKAKTLEQLDDPQIANTLGREIQDAANTKLGLDGGITRVYFTQLVVQ